MTLALLDTEARLFEELEPPLGEEEAIVSELEGVQGQGVDLGGYYHVDRDKATAVMRPSRTFNEAIDAL